MRHVGLIVRSRHDPRKRQARSRHIGGPTMIRARTTVVRPPGTKAPKKSVTWKNGEIVAVGAEGLKRELIPAEVTTSESKLVAAPATS